MPPDGAAEVAVAGETLWLLPQCAVFWPRTETLLVADAHFGKAAAFRRGGIPVPTGTTGENLRALAAVVRVCRARRIVFLGDLVHSAAGKRGADAAFTEWRAAHVELDLVLVRGNHDRHAGDPPPGWRVTAVPEPFAAEGFALCHAPGPVSGFYALAGHIHPSARIHGRGRDHLRLPCFWFTQTYAVLPAFGALTGTADVEPREGDRVFLALGDRVIAAR